MVESTKVLDVAYANDRFRKSGFGVTVTSGIQDLPDIEELLRAVRTFDKFTKHDDLYGWHDLGRFEWRGQSVIWKIDYFDEQLKHFEDPLSETCKRIVTIMLASEY